MIRKAQFSGTFYPDDPKELRKMLEYFYNNADVEATSEDCLGLIIPHAGYVFSGQTAAYSFKYISKLKKRKAVIIAPSHHCMNINFSISDYESYETPLGQVKVDVKAVQEFLNSGLFFKDQKADMTEHSLEVMLPFLYFLNPEIEIIPILFEIPNRENSNTLINYLINYYKSDFSDVVFIISSDLSHYHSSSIAKQMDLQLIHWIQSLETERFLKEIYDQTIEACGFGGILFIMELAKQTGYQHPLLLKYSHSGEINHRNDQVVGYVSIAINR